MTQKTGAKDDTSLPFLFLGVPKETEMKGNQPSIAIRS